MSEKMQEDLEELVRKADELHQTYRKLLEINPIYTYTWNDKGNSLEFLTHQNEKTEEISTW